MALYLWQMIPLIVVTLVGYPTGLLHQPPIGSELWWLARLESELVLAVVTVILLGLLSWRRSLFAAPLPTFTTPVRESVSLAARYLGTAACAVSLGVIAATGFAPNGRFPVVPVVLFAAGALLVAVGPRDTLVDTPGRTPAQQAP